MSEKTNLRIAVQAKGRLNEQSMDLLKEAGITVNAEKRKFLMPAADFPAEVIFLRDDDIPQTVALGAADVGIVGYNEVMEKKADVDILQKLGFGGCRLSLAIPKGIEYAGLEFFNAKRVATSYPEILGDFFARNGIKAEIHTISGSVEIAPAAGLADAIFDIVSSGGTLVSNGLVEVETVLRSEAVLIGNRSISEEKAAVASQLMSRFTAVMNGVGKKYIMMNVPETALGKAMEILPAMRSPTVIPLAGADWCSVQTVVDERDIWNIIEQLKQIGAEGILVLSMDKIVL